MSPSALLNEGPNNNANISGFRRLFDCNFSKKFMEWKSQSSTILDVFWKHQVCTKVRNHGKYMRAIIKIRILCERPIRTNNLKKKIKAGLHLSDHHLWEISCALSWDQSTPVISNELNLSGVYCFCRHDGLFYLQLNQGRHLGSSLES